MLILSCTLLLLLSALYVDLRYERIPNMLVLMAFALALLIHAYMQQWTGLLVALQGAGLALAMLLPAYAIRWLGAGDVKLMIAVGAFAGPHLLFWSVVYGIICGAFTSFALVLFKVGGKGLLNIIKRRYIRRKADGSQEAPLQVPYAPALALGWLLACFNEPEVITTLGSFSNTLSGYF
jgi:prepilin peptidase CpaA